MEKKLVNAGDFAVTPFPPVGLVKVLSIEPAMPPYGESARVLFLHDHYGYPQGDIGNYPRHELIKVDDAVESILDEYAEERLGLKPPHEFDR